MPIINPDFTEVSAPTAKQIDFVQEMYHSLSKVCPIEMPEYTFEAYSNFISEFIQDYYDLCDISEDDFFPDG